MNLDKFKSKQGHFIETIDGKHVFKIGKYTLKASNVGRKI